MPFLMPHFHQAGQEPWDGLCLGQPPTWWGRGRLGQKNHGTKGPMWAPLDSHLSGLSGLSFQLKDLHFQRGTYSPKAQILSQGSGGRGGGRAEVSTASLSAQTQLVCLQGREEKHDPV